MAYSKTTWQDLPNTTTPITATRLNNIENGIKENDDKLLGNKVMGNIVVDSIKTKNLFDKNTLVQGDITNGFPNIRISSRQALWLEAGTYTFSTNLSNNYNFVLLVQNVGIPPLSSQPTFIYDSGWQTAGTTSKTFTISNAGWFMVYLRRNDNGNFTSTDISNLLSYNYQLEKGSTATSLTAYQNLNNEELYTTGEQRIGRWINGKPLYRKVISTTLPNGTIDISIASNIQIAFLEFGYFNSPSSGTNRYFPVPFINDSGLRVTGWGLSSGSFHLVNEITSYVSSTCYLSILYTKTTD